MIKYTILTPFADGEKSGKSEEPGKNCHERSQAVRFSQLAEKEKNSSQGENTQTHTTTSFQT